jgi:hypothetical protein
LRRVGPCADAVVTIASAAVTANALNTILISFPQPISLPALSRAVLHLTRQSIVAT